MPDPTPFDLPAELLDDATVQLVDVAGDGRERVLAALLAANPAHAAGLRTLAASLADADRVLARSLVAATPANELPELPGYRVLRRIGEGAFGIVYLCEQHDPIRRDVAVKLLRPGAGDRSTLARFDSERRFLARLNHQAIAQIFDAGLLADGRPWFVMEHVSGVPLVQYCDRARMPIDARLRLFVRLCQGVQHAHDQGIVHRDLKPANILVVEVDGEAQPKIIDFGVARALERPAERSEAHTETGRVVGTPGYMSPEQMAGDLGAIDARTDLFSLGVVLYELLSGELPWGKRPVSTASEPPRPSSRITAATEQCPTVAERRSSQPRRLAAQLRGDLDWIVLKALSRERERRYATALELAADVLRHLRGDAVHAGPPAFSYRLRKLVRRHRQLLTTLTAATVLLVGGAFVLHGYRTEARNRLLAMDAAVDSLVARANDANLVDNPGAESLRELLVRDALRLADEIPRDAHDARSLARRARILWTLSQVDWLLHRFESSAKAAREAITAADAAVIASPEDGTCRLTLGNAERNLGRALTPLGRTAEARPHFERAVALLERCSRDGVPYGRSSCVRAMVELYTALDVTVDAGRRTQLLATARDLQQAIVRDHPQLPAERGTLIEIELMRCTAALQCHDLPGARALLEPAEAMLGAEPSLGTGTIARICLVAADVAVAGGDLAAAYGHLERGLTTCRGAMARAPSSPQPLSTSSWLLDKWVALHEIDPATTETETRDAMQECVAHGERWIARFPDDPDATTHLAGSVSKLTMRLLMSGRRRDAKGLDARCRLVCEQLDRMSTAFHEGHQRRMRWLTAALLGMVADASGLADADAIWMDVAVRLQEWSVAQPIGEAAGSFTMYFLRIASRHLAAGRLADAQAWLDRVDDLLAGEALAASSYPTFAPEAARLAAAVAVQRGDFATAASHAELALEPGGWRAHAAAVDAMTGVWRAAQRAGDASAATWRDRAIELGELTIARLHSQRRPGREDPWVEVSLAKTHVRLLLARRDRGDDVPAATVETALAGLAKWRDEVHAVEWDEALWLAGQALAAR
jgi:serine/threonine protein kinase